MTTSLRSIIAELYELDPSLKEHERELLPILEKLLAARPDAKPTKAFVNELRSILQSAISDQRHVRTTGHLPPATRHFPLSFMPRYSFAIAGVLVGILVTAPVMYYGLTSGGRTSTIAVDENGEPIDGGPNSHMPLFTYSIEREKPSAFGSLSDIANNAGNPGRGGGGGVTQAAVSAEESGDAKIAAPGTDSLMYPYYQARYVYAGDPLVLPAGQLTVYKRLKDMTSSGIGTLLTQNFGLVDLNSFDKLNLELFNLFEDKDRGYSATVNLRDASISINQFWEKWPNPYANCDTEACYQQLRIKEGEIPGDAQLIAIANAFVEEHGIGVENTGEPYVDNTWREQFARTQNKADFYYPDSVSVIYPFTIEGEPVYEEYGNRAGLTVSISVREKAVMSVWNMYSQRYQSSEYAAVTDPQKVLGFINRMSGIDPAATQTDPNMRIVDVKLGTPTKGLARMFRYNGKTSGEELFVPALIFKAEAPTQNDVYFQPYVVVPLAEEILAERGNVGGPVMPLIREEAAASVEE